MEFQRLRGVRDILPEETPIWQHVESVCRSRFSAYAYSEIRTPIIESASLFQRSLGEGSDVVRKEMYQFQDKGEREITLRPEGTAGVVRALIEAGVLNRQMTGVAKVYYMGSMYRYDRPQAGRYREFYQAGVEALGSESPALDVEVILLALDIFEKLELKDLSVAINSIGCRTCRPAYVHALDEFLVKSRDKLDEDCQGRMAKNVLRVLDCKNPSCQKVFADAPRTVDHLCRECQNHFEVVQNLLKKRGVTFTLDSKLVRGLDYYTRTAFEVLSGQLGSQSAVCGGGRYDNLVEELGGPSIPAVGFAIGLDRLISLLSKDLQEKLRRPIEVFIIPMGKEASEVALTLSVPLRAKGYRVEIGWDDRGLKGSLKGAARLGVRAVVIMGEEEMKTHIVQIKNMETGSQEGVKLEEVVVGVGRILGDHS